MAIPDRRLRRKCPSAIAILNVAIPLLAADWNTAHIPPIVVLLASRFQLPVSASFRPLLPSLPKLHLLSPYPSLPVPLVPLPSLPPSRHVPIVHPRDIDLAHSDLIPQPPQIFFHVSQGLFGGREFLGEERESRGEGIR